MFAYQPCRETESSGDAVANAQLKSPFSRLTTSSSVFLHDHQLLQGISPTRQGVTLLARRRKEMNDAISRVHIFLLSAAVLRKDCTIGEAFHTREPRFPRTHM